MQKKPMNFVSRMDLDLWARTQRKKGEVVRVLGCAQFLFVWSSGFHYNSMSFMPQFQYLTHSCHPKVYQGS